MNNNISNKSKLLLSIPIVGIIHMEEPMKTKFKLELKAREELKGCYIATSEFPQDMQEYLIENGVTDRFIYLDDMMF